MNTLSYVCVKIFHFKCISLWNVTSKKMSFSSDQLEKVILWNITIQPHIYIAPIVLKFCIDIEMVYCFLYTHNIKY
jgi:hypothetical protein